MIDSLLSSNSRIVLGTAQLGSIYGITNQGGNPEQKKMTEIIHGRRVFVAEEHLLLKWWKSIDQWTLISSLILILVGLLLSMAASVPLAESHEKPPFYYVYRHLIYGKKI